MVLKSDEEILEEFIDDFDKENDELVTAMNNAEDNGDTEEYERLHSEYINKLEEKLKKESELFYPVYETYCDGTSYQAICRWKKKQRENNKQ